MSEFQLGMSGMIKPQTRLQKLALYFTWNPEDRLTDRTYNITEKHKDTDFLVVKVIVCSSLSSLRFYLFVVDVEFCFFFFISTVVENNDTLGCKCTPTKLSGVKVGWHKNFPSM